MGVPGWLWLCVLLVLGAVCGIAGSSCRLLDTRISQRVYKEGDVVIGGMFPIHSKPPKPKLDFTQRPELLQCRGFLLTPYRWLQTVIFAVEEINRNPQLLPNLTLGYALADTCVTKGTALGAALGLVTGKNRVVTGSGCGRTPEVPVIIGDPCSSVSKVIARALGVFSIPMAIAHMVSRFGWTWVGLLVGDDNYGKSGIQLLLKELENSEVCVAFSEIIPKVNMDTSIPRIVEKVKQSTVKVILTFNMCVEMTTLLREVVRQNITDRQWIATETWATSSLFASPVMLTSLKGTIGFALRKANIQGLKSFLTRFKPSDLPSDPFVQEFWEILRYLRTVNFTTTVGDAVYFNENSETPASYDIMNWHVGAEGKVEFVKVGQFDAADGSDSKFDMDIKKVIWGGGQTEPTELFYQVQSRAY
ncbi:hypothetical protein SKAU_G00078270 [Synaphobranchus kaupii]|uniref:Receptor ligand binding region domain-containing protein n=1 Tax=Synaphobranchus kaupii TaxID=118154 RepID=A0A9Q1FUT3_SYNKA|nr:hypothetical protein SKAU_G00078270 [Synaphobranchus kaupii]